VARTAVAKMSGFKRPIVSFINGYIAVQIASEKIDPSG